MVLKIVRYLGQQGYGSDKIVVLTPYLGQLRELQKGLRETNDAVLNDLDSYALVRAGLISQSSANVARKSIRLATIGKIIPIGLFFSDTNTRPFQIIIRAKSQILSLSP